MLLSWIVFLGGFARRVHGNHVSCLAVAALLHYLILASFMWMLMEGVLAYLMLVKVFDASYSRFMVKAALFAWGLPIVPVAGVIAIDHELYHGGEKYCWMSRTPFYYAFLLPVAMVMLTNIVVYILVVASICRRRGLAAKASRSASSQRAVEIRASLSCFVVLGLSWVFAFLAIEDARVVFQYLFTITTSLQGFLIFLVFTARNADVKSFLRNLTVSRNPSTSTTTSSGSGSSSKAAVGTSTSRVNLGRK
ncbi:adhesion G protein-coupled receptor E5-like [Littorina saxatilis]